MNIKNENLVYISKIIVITDVGFHLNSGFMKILCTLIFPLCGFQTNMVECLFNSLLCLHIRVNRIYFMSHFRVETNT